MNAGGSTAPVSVDSGSTRLGGTKAGALGTQWADDSTTGSFSGGGSDPVAGSATAGSSTDAAAAADTVDSNGLEAKVARIDPSASTVRSISPRISKLRISLIDERISL